MEKKALILLRGLPGSGKSTLAELLAEKTYPVYSADDFFIDAKGVYNFDRERLREAHERCQMNTEESMRNGVSKIFVANTFTQEWEMDEYVLLASQYDYQIHFVIVENRHGNSNIHGAPDEAVERMRNRFKVKL